MMVPETHKPKICRVPNASTKQTVCDLRASNDQIHGRFLRGQ